MVVLAVVVIMMVIMVAFEDLPALERIVLGVRLVSVIASPVAWLVFLAPWVGVRWVVTPNFN